ncbi:MAG: STAS domain-containing protein [Verrucomicrobiae bacterium]|nr:STAS domain-containing protein [Verrucomicrobiae bacterium]
MFTPKLVSLIREGYPRRQLLPDITAGVIVGIVALPLAIAFAIASGVPPDKGLITAIVAGFLISALSGSRVQIGGPTGAFIVIVYGIVERHGLPGLTAATFMAGFLLILMGVARLGVVIQFIPHSLIVGFTSGIALLILSSQIKDFLGLDMGAVPAEFLHKWTAYLRHAGGINWVAASIAIGTVAIIVLTPRVTTRIPGSLIAIVVATVAVQWGRLPVETIATRFGEISGGLPVPHLPAMDLATLRDLVGPAFTIALLGAIESLLSAVVADGMTGGSHRSNQELVAQGVANIGSGLFGGIPATGAIARTATNIKNGGRTPVAGMVHAATLLVIVLFAGKWAKWIPLSCLAGILAVVAYNMSEWRSAVTVFKGPPADALVLVTTLLLTVLVDLTVAIEVGMVLAAFLFMRSMAQLSRVKSISDSLTEEEGEDPEAAVRREIPDGVEVYEVQGPLFFGAAHSFKESIGVIGKAPPGVLIIRMRHVPMIDATGIHSLKEVLKRILGGGKTRVVVCGVQPEVRRELERAGIPDLLGEGNVCGPLQRALDRARVLLAAAEATRAGR